jgi:sialate O-acetylesterase
MQPMRDANRQAACSIAYAMLMKHLTLLAAFSLAFGGAYAQLRLHPLFSDGMVLQRNQAIPVWGWAAPGEKIQATLAGQALSTRADASGRWELRFSPLEAGGPLSLSVKGKKQALLCQDILVGEVWICSGQSNMEWKLADSRNAAQEIAEADYPAVRLFDVPNRIAASPQAEPGPAAWKACSPASAGSFTAVGYFFARKLHQELKVPIGLIEADWGGTEIETWISGPALEAQPGFEGAASDLAGKIGRQGAKARQRLEALVASFGPPVAESLWAGEHADVSAWKSMRLPTRWEEAGLDEVDGVIWFRKELEITAEVAAQGGTLHLGAIDDSDQTFVNGQLVGETLNRYSAPRAYIIPPGLLKAGRNVIAVRVEDTGGGGGLYGDGHRMELTSQAQRIPLEGEWRYRISPQSLSYPGGSQGPNSLPSLLYNGMIAPLLPYAIQGVIWYQGESNAARAYQYRSLFPAMIQDWRQAWGREMPFLFVQLANYMQAQPEPGESAWAELREAQALALRPDSSGKAAATGMAVTLDIGAADDIHPRNKQDVGLRLALPALARVYGYKGMIYSGPVYRSMRIEGNRIVLSFDHAGSGLAAKDKYGYLKGFTIAGADRKFVWAMASITGQGEISVFSPEVPDPLAVRYGWADNPDEANLYNHEGLPAAPFRTDSWPGLTEEARRRYPD